MTNHDLRDFRIGLHQGLLKELLNDQLCESTVGGHTWEKKLTSLWDSVKA